MRISGCNCGFNYCILYINKYLIDEKQLKNSIDIYQQWMFIKFGVGLDWTMKQIHKQLVQLLGEPTVNVQ